MTNEYSAVLAADEIGPLPDWLTVDPSSRRRVHVCWAANWRGALAAILAQEASEGWDMPFTAEPGDVVLTVLATTPPLVVFAELAGEPEVDTDGVDLFEPEDWFLLAEPVVWHPAHVGRSGDRHVSSTLLPDDAQEVLVALAREHRAGGSWPLDPGVCGTHAEVSSVFHVLRLVSEARLAGADSPLGRVSCASCRTAVDLRDVVVHRTDDNASGPWEPRGVVHGSVLVCEPCHVGIHSGRLSETGSPCPSCGAVDQAVEVVIGMPGPPETRDPDVVYWGCIVMPRTPQWQCRACGKSYGVWDAR